MTERRFSIKIFDTFYFENDKSPGLEQLRLALQWT